MHKPFPRNFTINYDNMENHHQLQSGSELFLSTPDTGFSIKKPDKVRQCQQVILRQQELMSLNESNRSDADLEVHTLSMTPGPIDMSTPKSKKRNKMASLVCSERIPSTGGVKSSKLNSLHATERRTIRKSNKKLDF